VSEKEPLTVGDGFRIAIGIFLFNLLVCAVVGLVWMMWTVLSAGSWS